LALLALSVGCDGDAEVSEAPGGAASDRAPVSSEHAVGKQVVAALDQGSDPCVDFYQYACGGWLGETKLPADKPRYTRGFSTLADQNNEVLRKIMEESKEGEGELAKVGAYYGACMDEGAIDGHGIEPLKPYLAKIDGIKDAKTMMRVTGEFHGTIFSGHGALFSYGRGPDLEDPEVYITHLGQGGTGLPDRSFYLEEAKKQQILPAYTAHVARMLTYLGKSPEDSAKAAEAIVAFETKLAEVQKPRDEMRDPTKLVNRWDRKGVAKKVKLDWKGYFKALGHPKMSAINVTVPQFFEALPALLAETDASVLRDYMRWHLISSTASLLSKEIVEADFQFAGALTGTKELSPRWERCVGATNGALADAVGKGFVAETFAGDSKDVANTMIADVEAAFERGLPDLKWMDDTTRGKAVEKMNAVVNKVGYPDKWKDYEGLEVGEDHFANVVAAREFEYQRELSKVGQKVDKAEWFWPASIVNAAYNPTTNEMMFPAGILQPPFFSRDFPTAMNYGAMGMVMGHELTHGFDDSGRKFDGTGRLTEWWAPEVAERFESEAQCIDDTYSQIEIQPGVKLNGKLTLGENIADFGGLKSAHGAYQHWVQEKGAEDAIVEGMSNEQLLFVAYAQGWCTLSSPEFDRLMATTDSHSPPKQRVNVTLSHFPGFWEAYGCGEGTAMHAEKVCSVW
jgi:endothelin-converting enzyme/putative endopeptidase